MTTTLPAAAREVGTAGFPAADRDRAVRALLGTASRGGADAGEVLATVAAIEPDDRAGWIAAWSALGTRTAVVGATCAWRGHRVSAARAYLRAANYLAVAVDAITGRPGAGGLLPTFHAHRAAWEGFVATTRWPVERVDVPYEGTSLPGWLFHPDATGAPRPTLVVDNGDGALSGAWCECAEGALERGYAVLLFDGPGQQSMVLERGVPLRHDWEKVLTPVVDFLVGRADVDAGRLAVHGMSRAGRRVARALAFEHRFAAAVVDGGAVDVGRTSFAQVHPALLAVDERGDTEGFDTATADRITTPLHVTEPDGELAGLVPGATPDRFAPEEADHHGRPTARDITEQRTFDWLDDHLKERSS